MSRPITLTLVPVSVQRRSVLAFLGFTYDCEGGLWRRGALALSDEVVDGLSSQAFEQRVRYWRTIGGPNDRSFYDRGNSLQRTRLP